MFFFRKNKNQKKTKISKQDASPRRSVLIEGLEGRTLMSSTMTSDLVYYRQSTTNSTTVEGYTPAEIRTAYGFDSATLGTSGVTADGAGQTIAIIDAYNDPNITSDLGVFDSEFDLPAASLSVVNQTGGSSLPTSDAGWAGEISLDVEWAHAIAPAANILLVETNSDSTDDLMAGVNYARTVSAVSVISMSWGGSESIDWGYGGESTSQTSYDSDFTTPAGHQGITFVAAAGDSGSQSGVEWPASSPNVISVGGTTLTLNSDGSYSSESGWNGTSGGYSQVEAEPTYQDVVQDTGYRSSPDVAYDADPNTGFAVYDSVADDGVSGWQDVGGTSAGSPQWAALIAIADQGRVIDGNTTLDGASQTLPDLYSLYGDPDTSAYDTYTTYFNDVESSGNGPVGFGWGGRGRSQGSAGVGYDTQTGLGSPHAADVIDALDGDTSTGSTTGGSTGSNGSSGTTTPASVPVSPLSITITKQPVASIIGGAAGSVKVQVTNTTESNFNGQVTITLYASTDDTVSSDDTVIKTLTIPDLKLASGGLRNYTLKFDYPSNLVTGNYDIIATVDASATDDATADAESASPVTITAPVVDLATAFASETAIAVRPGKGDSVAITITNTGNVTASGTLDLILYASTNGVIDSSSTQLASITNRVIKIKPGKKLTLHLVFKAPADLTAGSYSLIATTTSKTTPTDVDTSNDTATIETESA